MPRTIPDALGIRGRAQIAFQELHSLQHRLMMLAANLQDGGHKDDDAVPNPDAGGRTFAQERTRVEAAIEAWGDRHAHLVAAVENIIKRNERAAEAQERTRLEGNLEAWGDRHAHLVAAVENIIKRNERAAEAQEKAEATAAK